MIDDRSDTVPFFIVGVQRSGTTMLRLMLNAHSRLTVPFESSFIPTFFRRLDQYGDLSRKANRRRMLRDIAKNNFVRRGGLLTDIDAVLQYPISSYADLVDAIFTEYAKGRGKARWGDKTPTHVTHIDVLDRLFPSCRIIHLVRDGRDVALSHRRVDWGSKDLPFVASDWRWRTTLAHKMGALLNDRFLEVKFEELVRHPTESLKAICEFLGENYERGMLEYPSEARQALPESSQQWHSSSVSPPNPGKVESWRERMSKPDQAIFERVAGEALDLFGYERTSGERPFLDRVRTRLRMIQYTITRR